MRACLTERDLIIVVSQDKLPRTLSFRSYERKRRANLEPVITYGRQNLSPFELWIDNVKREYIEKVEQENRDVTIDIPYETIVSIEYE